MAAEILVRGPVHREDGQTKTFVKICFTLLPFRPPSSWTYINLFIYIPNKGRNEPGQVCLAVEASLFDNEGDLYYKYL